MIISASTPLSFRWGKTQSLLHTEYYLVKRTYMKSTLLIYEWDPSIPALSIQQCFWDDVEFSKSNRFALVYIRNKLCPPHQGKCIKLVLHLLSSTENLFFALLFLLLLTSSPFSANKFISLKYSCTLWESHLQIWGSWHYLPINIPTTYQEVLLEARNHIWDLQQRHQTSTYSCISRKDIWAEVKRKGNSYSNTEYLRTVLSQLSTTCGTNSSLLSQTRFTRFGINYINVTCKLLLLHGAEQPSRAPGTWFAAVFLGFLFNDS